jgi:hypothetical protein
MEPARSREVPSPCRHVDPLLASDDCTRRALSQLLRGLVGPGQVCMLGTATTDLTLDYLQELSCILYI